MMCPLGRIRMSWGSVGTLPGAWICRTSVPSSLRSSVVLVVLFANAPRLCDHSRSPLGSSLASSGATVSLYQHTGAPSRLKTATYGFAFVPWLGVMMYHCCVGCAYFVNVNCGKSDGRQR